MSVGLGVQKIVSSLKETHPDATFVSPVAYPNSQREDTKSPHFRLQGSQQCMGNSFRNVWNWLGNTEKVFSSVKKMNDHSYYASLEFWMMQKGFAKEKVYETKEHVNYMNETFANNNFSKYEAKWEWLGNKNLEKVGKNLISSGCPAVISGEFTGQGGHVVSVFGASPKGLFLIDSWGNPLTRYVSKNNPKRYLYRDQTPLDGFMVFASYEFLKMCKINTYSYLTPTNG